MVTPRNRGERRTAAATSKARPNKHAGEAALHAGGEIYKLKLTLNALCEIEDHFECTISEVAKRLKANPSMKDIRAFLGPMVRGGGADLSDEEVGALDFDVRSMGSAIGAVLQANFTADGELDEAPDAPEGEAPAPGN